MKTLALFDFDGTITRKDSFIEFLKFYAGGSGFLVGMLKNLPILILYKLKLVPNYKAKEAVLSTFFKDKTLEAVEKAGAEYTQSKLSSIVKKSALERLNWHKSEGHRVVLVSASVDIWLKEWCSEQDIELICTVMQVEAGKLTGKIEGKNCYGQEKVNRVKAHLDIKEYAEIYAYGDSGGDREMLAIAQHSFYRYFN